MLEALSSKDELISLLSGCELGNLLAERVMPYFPKKDAFSLLKIYVDTMTEFWENTPKDTVIRCWLTLTEHPEVTDGSAFHEAPAQKHFAAESLELIFKALQS